MKKAFVILTLLTPMVFMASPAMAKGIRIPGFQTQTVVQAADLPDVPAFQRSDGRYVDIGYKHQVWSAGEWVLYIGSSDEYLQIEHPQLLMVLAAAGIGELPPVPAKPFSILLVEGLSIAFVLALAFAGLQAFMRRRRTERLQQSIADLETDIERSELGSGNSRPAPRKSFGRRLS